MATLKQFTDRVRMYVGGIPELTMREFVIEAAREFCEKSLYLRKDTAVQDIVSGSSFYTPTAIADLDIVAAIRVEDSTKIVDPRSEDQLDNEWPKLNWRYPYYSTGTYLSTPWRTMTGPQAVFYYHPDVNTIRLVPVPDTTKTGGLFIRIAAKPSRTATTIDDLLYNEWLDEIARGAVGLLQRIDNRPWTSVRSADRHLKYFENGYNEARSRVNRSNNRNTKGIGRSRAYYR